MLRRIFVAALSIPLTLIGLLVLLWGLALLRENDASVPPTTTLVETRLGRIAATVSGPADGAPVLLVHGTAAWSSFWRDVAAHLAARGHRVIAVDLPPFGYSDHDPQARYDRTSQAERLAALLRATTNRPAAIVGHSFGAGATTELALREPRLVSRLILVDAALGDFDPEPGARSTAEQVMGVTPVAQPLIAATATNPPMMGPLLRSMIARKDAAAPWLDTLRQPMRRPGTTAAYAAWTPALFALDDGGLSRKSSELAKIRVPVALIWGDADTVTPLAQGERIAALTRARSFATLKGVGHIPHIEAPAEFLAALDAALAQP